MSTTTKIVATAASAGVLAIGWQVGLQQDPTLELGSTAEQPSSVPAATGSSSSSSTKSTSSTPSAIAATPMVLKDGTYTGASTTYRYGTTQVSITVTGGSITDVQAVYTAAEGHSEQIQSRAKSVLRQQVLKAQSAKIATVSGATFTTQSFTTSLQSALAQAQA